MLIVGNGKLLTFNDADPFIENGAVVIDGSTISCYGTDAEIRASYPQAEFIDVDGAVIMPGFIDMHAHSRNMLLCGKALPRFSGNDRNFLYGSLLNRVEAEASPQNSMAASYAFAVNCIMRGITTVFDHHFNRAQISGSLNTAAQIYRECGLRACICLEVNERHGIRNLRAAIQENVEFIDFCRDLDIETLQVMFGLDSVMGLNVVSVIACLDANGGKAGFCFHFEQKPEEILLSIRKYGVRPAKRLADLGIASNGSIAAGCVFSDEEEIETLLESGCGIVITPMLANLLSSSYASCFETGAAGGLIALGTDSLCADTLHAARYAFSQFCFSNRDCPNVYDPIAAMLFKANAALASETFGRTLGVIETGAAADIIALRVNGIGEDATESQIVNAMLAGFVSGCELTIVAGKVLMKDGVIRTADQKTVFSELFKASNELEI